MIPQTKNIIEINKWLNTELSSCFEERERQQIIRILNEDILDITSHLLQPEITTEQRERLQDAVKRLKTDEPIQYITGKVHFYNLIMDIKKGVLIPRPETEELVDLLIKNSPANAKILDLCSGSGCIALAIKKALPDSQVYALEKFENALDQAKQNAYNCKLAVNWICGDIFDSDWMNISGVLDIIVSNPPYIPEEDKNSMAGNVLNFEPEAALFVPDNEPLLFYKRIAEIARIVLSARGQAFCEVHEAMAKDVKNIFITANFQEVDIIEDLQGKDRMIWAR